MKSKRSEGEKRKREEILGHKLEEIGIWERLSSLRKFWSDLLKESLILGSLLYLPSRQFCFSSWRNSQAYSQIQDLFVEVSSASLGSFQHLSLEPSIFQETPSICQTPSSTLIFNKDQSRISHQALQAGSAVWRVCSRLCPSSPDDFLSSYWSSLGSSTSNHW